jgi:hypothetical protein
MNEILIWPVELSIILSAADDADDDDDTDQTIHVTTPSKNQ